jgi:hypothetical protein
MARSQITLTDPQISLPLLLLEWMDHSGGVQLGYAPGRSLQGLSSQGSSIITGPVYGSIYSWAFSVDMPEDQWLLLQQYIALQAQREYYLLTDEYHPVCQAEASTRNVFTTQQIGNQTAYFCIFKVWLALAQNPIADRGYSASRDQRWTRVSFTATELPEVAP